MWGVFAPIAAGYTNNRRGRGVLPAPLFAITIGVINAPVFAAVFPRYGFWWDCLALLAGFAAGAAIWKAPGWGLFFSAFHGRWPLSERECWPVDKIGLWVIPWIGEHDAESNMRRGVFCFCLRALIYTLPLFGFLAWWINSPYPLLLWPATIGQGFIYGFMRNLPESEGKQVPTAEFLTWYFYQGILIAVLLPY